MRSLGAVLPLIVELSLASTFGHQSAVATSHSSMRVTPPASRTLVITAHDYAYTGLPVRAPAGWLTVKMVNAGRELHMLATFDVPKGYTASTLIDSLTHGKVPADLREWGGPNAVAPGDTTTTSLFLPAGNYVVGCFVVSPDGKTHFMKGMMGSFEVVAAPTAGSPPPSDRRILLSTYKIAMLGGPIDKGAHTFLIRNTAKERHDFVILRVLPGHTVDQALAWFGNPPVGSPAAEPIAGTTVLHTNEEAYLQAHFTPGTYVLVCWLATNKKYHYHLGMENVFTVPAT